MNNNDIQMTEKSDISLMGRDISTTNSIKQAILIRLRWFFAEWQYGPQYGVRYFEDVFIKNPNRTLVLSMISEIVRSVEGVKSVTDLTMQINNRTREANIRFTVTTTDKERFVQEVNIWRFVSQIYKMRYSENDAGDLLIEDGAGINHGAMRLTPAGELEYERTAGMDDLVGYDIDTGDLLETRKED